MKRLFYLGFTAILALVLSGCGGGGDSRTIFVAQIFSDQPTDGDIALDRVLQTFTITQGPNTLFFGIDELDPNLPEFRAFLDFPLDGSTGQDVVPADAVIVSATLEVTVVEVSFATVVPTLIELIRYPISGLTQGDFDSDPLASRALDFLSSDVNLPAIAIDVTPLMLEAQRLGLLDFQVRFLLDFVPNAFGIVGIDDRPTVALTAPLLTVEFH